MEECLGSSTSGSKMYTVLVASLQIVCRKQHIIYFFQLLDHHWMFVRATFLIFMMALLWEVTCFQYKHYSFNQIKPVIHAIQAFMEVTKRMRIKSFAAIAVKRHGRECKLVKTFPRTIAFPEGACGSVLMGLPDE